MSAASEPVRVEEWSSQLSETSLFSHLTFVTALALMFNQTTLPFAWVFQSGRWISMIALAGAGAVWWISARGRPRRIYWFDLTNLLFIAWALATTRYSLDWKLTLGRSASVALMYAAVCWGVWWEVDRRGPAAVARALVNAVAVIVGLSLLVTPFLPTFAAYWRYQGILANPNALGLLLALLLPLALWAAGAQTHANAYKLLAGLMLVIMVASQSRTMLLASAVGAGYFAYHVLPWLRQHIVRISVAVIAFSILVPQISWVVREYPARRLELRARAERLRQAEQRIRAAEHAVQHLPEELRIPLPDSSEPTDDPVVALRRELSRSKENYDEALRAMKEAEPQLTLWDVINLAGNPRSLDVETASGRTIAWKVGWSCLMERPLTGFGFGTEEYILRARGFNHAISIFSGSYFHNSYLGLALQVGVPGAVLFFLPVLALVFVEWRSRGRSAGDPLRFALRAVLLTGAVSWLLESWPYSMGNAFSFPFWTSMMLLGWINLSDRQGAQRRSADAVA
jgi:O-antigen ligase